MPTGYTSEVQDGKITDFTDFALGCARAFGACIYQRDDNMKDPPKLRKSIDDSYHAKELKDLNDELNKLQQMKPADINHLQDERIKEATEWNKEYNDNKKLYKKRYETMLEKVRKWEPPTTEHEGLKKFMIEQLEESIKFDCSEYQPEVPKKVKPSQYIKEERGRLFKGIEYHTNEMRDENERNATANSWIIELFKSLGLKPPKEE